MLNQVCGETVPAPCGADLFSPSHSLYEVSQPLTDVLVFLLNPPHYLMISYSITKDTIDEQKAAAARAAYRVVVPGAESFDTTPEIENALAELDGGTYGTGYGRCRINEAYVATDADGNPAGYVVSVTSDDGFDGSISLAVGWSADGTMNGISFTELTETPGMGMRADEEGFKGQFRSRTEYPFKLTKSGDAAADEISAISGATITSTAVVNAVNAASDFCATYMMGGK